MDAHFLLFDIGNTNIKMGIATDRKLLATYVLPTNPAETPDSLGLNLLSFCAHYGLPPEHIQGCLACSVAPAMDPILRSACLRFFSKQLFFVSHDVEVPLENHYQRPQEVGADRLVTAFAARQCKPTRNIIVIDFGTATTFDCVQANAYLGGLICPGVLSSGQALFAKTAKLPQIRLDIDSKDLEIGKNTSQSLNQGLIFGFAALCEGICARLSNKLCPEAASQTTGIMKQNDVFVIATGGFAEKISQVCSCFDVIKPDLLLDGLRQLYIKEQEKAV